MKSPALPILAAALLASRPARAADPEWRSTVYPEDQLFSSYVVSTAMITMPEEDRPSWGDDHLGEDESVIGAYVEHVKKGARITVEVKKSPYIEGGKIVVKAPHAGDWLIHPKVAYDYDALVKVHQPKPINVRMEVSIDGASLGEQTRTVTLRSINDCLYGVDEGDDVFSDYNYLFAAYVNENHPWVDHILREALETGIVDSFDGYQSEDRDQVLRQIYAIWDVMQRRGMKYSSITATAFESDTIQSQHVRLFDDAIRAKQANCVDGTVLLAAVLRKIGLAPYLIGIPGHMYLAVDLTESESPKIGPDRIGLETTMMGAVDEDDVPDSAHLPDVLRAEWGARASWASFEGAVDHATRELKTDWRLARKAEDPGYQIIDVAEARRHGILPITSPDDGQNLEALRQEPAPVVEEDEE